MTETYHNEALRKQRIVDKKLEAIARIKYGEVRTDPFDLFVWRLKVYHIFTVCIHLIGKFRLISVNCSKGK